MGTAMKPQRRDDRSAAKPQPKARRQTAEYAEYAENRLPPGSPSAYFACSAVYLVPEDSSQPAKNCDFCSAARLAPQPHNLECGGKRSATPLWRAGPNSES